MLTNKELTRSWLFKLLAKLESFDEIEGATIKEESEITTLVISWNKK